MKVRNILEVLPVVLTNPMFLSPGRAWEKSVSGFNALDRWIGSESFLYSKMVRKIWVVVPVVLMVPRTGRAWKKDWKWLRNEMK